MALAGGLNSGLYTASAPCQKASAGAQSGPPVAPVPETPAMQVYTVQGSMPCARSGAMTTAAAIAAPSAKCRARSRRALGLRLACMAWASSGAVFDGIGVGGGGSSGATHAVIHLAWHGVVGRCAEVGGRGACGWLGAVVAGIAPRRLPLRAGAVCGTAAKGREIHELPQRALEEHGRHG